MAADDYDMSGRLVVVLIFAGVALIALLSIILAIISDRPDVAEGPGAFVGGVSDCARSSLVRPGEGSGDTHPASIFDMKLLLGQM